MAETAFSVPGQLDADSCCVKAGFLGTNGTDAFWTHSSDIYDDVFVPAMASSTVISDKPLDVPNACADERNQPMSLEPIERTLHPTETLRPRLDALHDALVQASDQAKDLDRCSLRYQRSALAI